MKKRIETSSLHEAVTAIAAMRNDEKAQGFLVGGNNRLFVGLYVPVLQSLELKFQLVQPQR